MTPGSLENASCTTWAKILDDTKLLGDERATLSEEMRMQVAEPIKALNFRWEDFRKRCEALNVKLLEDRDKSYTDLKHMQKKYFDQCSSVEKERQKASQDGRTDRSRHAKAMAANMSDMNNMKNNYIISINATNAHKTKYYHEDIPDLLDTFQDINEIRVQKLNAIWAKATQIEQSCLIRQGGHLGRSLDAIGRNSPNLDTAMFIQHNTSTWMEPVAFGFEPCPIWHDTPDLVVDDNAKIFLQNGLAKRRRELSELTATVSNKKREIDGLSKLKEAYIVDPSRGVVEDVISNLIASRTDAANFDYKRKKLETEVATVTQIAGNIDTGLTEHQFKSASFAIPTTCDLCGSTIWGMSRKGYHCKACSYNCHKNCQMKVPSNCTQEKGNKRSAVPDGDAGSITRTTTTESVYGVGGRPAIIQDTDSDEDAASVASSAPSSSRRSAGPPRRNMAPPPTSGFSGGTSTSLSGTKVLYAYDAANPGEISVSEGDLVTVIEGDDGQGWIKIKSARGEGLVPGAYVENATPNQATRPVSGNTAKPIPGAGVSTGAAAAASVYNKQPPAVAPKRSVQRKAGRQVRALYDYEANGDGELSIVEGDLISLTLEDQGDGWATGEVNGRTGIFPAAYVGAA